MFQSIAIGCFFLASFVTLIATPQPSGVMDDVAPAAAVQLIADVEDDEPPPSTVPPALPAPDPFEGVTPPTADPAAPGATPAPAPMPVAEPPPPTWVAGPQLLQGGEVLATASALLGVPYVWGGNSTGGMDCSAYVSRAWGLSRQTTDTLHAYSSVISKEQLLPGDAMNLTRAQDPRGYGHVRLFAAWANEEHSLMWVYEETPRQAVYHAIAYDPRYTPIRRTRIATEGVTAPLIPVPVAPKRAPAATSTPSRNGSPTGTPTIAVRAAVSTPTPRPIATPIPYAAIATPARVATRVPPPSRRRFPRALRLRRPCRRGRRAPRRRARPPPPRRRRARRPRPRLLPRHQRPQARRGRRPPRQRRPPRHPHRHRRLRARRRRRPRRHPARPPRRQRPRRRPPRRRPSAGHGGRPGARRAGQRVRE